MADGEEYRERRRTGFENDLREFFFKILFGVIIGLGVKYFTFWDGWTLPLVLGVLASFFLASLIRGSSRHGDERN